MYVYLFRPEVDVMRRRSLVGRAHIDARHLRFNFCFIIITGSFFFSIEEKNNPTKVFVFLTKNARFVCTTCELTCAIILHYQISAIRNQPETQKTNGYFCAAAYVTTRLIFLIFLQMGINTTLRTYIILFDCLHVL